MREQGGKWKIQNEISSTQDTSTKFTKIHAYFTKIHAYLGSYMEFTRVGPHGKKRLGEGTKNRWVVRREKPYTCKPGLVSRAVYVSSHFIFGIFYEVGTINSTVFFRWENQGLERSLCPWDSPGKNTGVGCHALLQGIFLTQESNPYLLSPPALAPPNPASHEPATNTPHPLPPEMDSFLQEKLI